MIQKDGAIAEHLLKASNRRAMAREVLNELPPTGVRAWEFPLAYAMGALVATALYFGGQSPATSALAGIALLSAILAAAASAETRKLARRLKALETLLMQRTDAA